MSWFQLWTICWQVAVFLTPLLLGCAVLWLRSQFVTKADAIVEKNRVDGGLAALRDGAVVERNRVDAIVTAAQKEGDRRWEVVRDQLADHHGRLKLIEADVAKPPSRHALNNSISVLQGGMSSVEKSVAALGHQFESQSADIRRQIDTLNGYLHTLVEKGLDR